MTSATCSTRSNVKASLTPRRRGRVIENDQYAAFVRRVIAAYSRRIAAGDIDAISDMTSTAAELDDAISQAVTGLRAAGYSWADIAARLGVSRQAAQQRWGEPDTGRCVPHRCARRSVSWSPAAGPRMTPAPLSRPSWSSWAAIPAAPVTAATLR
ncbi:MAG: hypothetical protein ACLPQY_32000 [Streptosporangiaceae bacterium]